jgi:EmrB/QacA subfamily drug resistance transporter
MTQAPETTASTGPEQPVHHLVIIMVSAGSFLAPFSMAAVNVALPAMGEALRADAFTLSLMPTVFLLCNVALILPFSRLADNYGRKRIYALGLCVSACGALCSYFAPSAEWILLFRAVQGSGSAMIFSSGLAIISSVFAANARGLPIGLNTAAVYIGMTVAPALGGWVTDGFGWRGVFLLPVVPLLCVVALAILGLKGREWKKDQYSALDWRGALIYAGWTAALVGGLTSLPSSAGIMSLVLAALLLLVFLRHQSRQAEPLVRLELFRGNRLLTRSLACSSLMYAAAYPVSLLLSLYLQYITGLEAFEAGRILLYQALAMAFIAPFSGRVSDKIEPRVISTVGCIGVACGFGLLVQIGFDTPPYQVALALFFIGVGFSIFSVPNSNAVVSSVDANHIGLASATVNLARTTGNLVGISLVNMIVRQMLGEVQIEPEQYPALLSTIHTALQISLAFVLIACVLSATRGRLRCNPQSTIG